MPLRHARHELIDSILAPRYVRRHIQRVVTLILGGRDGMIEVIRRVVERCVDEPAGALASPDAPTEPPPTVTSPFMPGQVPDVSGFEFAPLPVVRPKDGDARV